MAELSHEQRKALFGPVTGRTPGGEFAADPERIGKIAAIDDVHLVVFCKGCGRHDGIRDEALAMCFFDIGGIEWPDSLDGKFMQVDQCPTCTCMTKPWDGMVLRDVSELK